MRVRRVYDPEHRTVIYVAYSTRLSDDKVTTGRYRQGGRGPGASGQGEGESRAGIGERQAGESGGGKGG